MWLRDFLPKHVPGARILTYGYDSKLFKNNSNASIFEYSKNLLEALQTARANVEVNKYHFNGYETRLDRYVSPRLHHDSLLNEGDLTVVGTAPTYNIYWP
jgi:hypothetical protein